MQITQKLPKSRLKSIRACQLKENLREIFKTAENSIEAAIGFDAWYSFPRRSRLEPFKNLKKHRQGILNGFDSNLSNGYVEGVNSLIQASKAKARG